jgi:hypothetical protein
VFLEVARSRLPWVHDCSHPGEQGKRLRGFGRSWDCGFPHKVVLEILESPSNGLMIFGPHLKTPRSPARREPAPLLGGGVSTARGGTEPGVSFVRERAWCLMALQASRSHEAERDVLLFSVRMIPWMLFPHTKGWRPDDHNAAGVGTCL